MADPDNVVAVLLREFRTEMSMRFAEMNTRFDGVDHRFEQLEKKVETIRQAMHGESLLVCRAVPEADERLAAIEKRPAALENSRPSGAATPDGPEASPVGPSLRG